VKLSDGPEQATELFVNAGVTVTIARTGELPAFTAVNDTIFPVPFAASPMAGLEFVHEYVVAPPVLVVTKLTAPVGAPLHTAWSAGSFTCAVGFTVMVKLSDRPVQLTALLVKEGVTVIVAVTGDVPLFTAANAGIFPEPLAASPTPGVSFIQE
jgi:hypothetical protein